MPKMFRFCNFQFLYTLKIYDTNKFIQMKFDKELQILKKIIIKYETS